MAKRMWSGSGKLCWMKRGRSAFDAVSSHRSRVWIMLSLVRSDNASLLSMLLSNSIALVSPLDPQTSPQWGGWHPQSYAPGPSNLTVVYGIDEPGRGGPSINAMLGAIPQPAVAQRSR